MSLEFLDARVCQWPHEQHQYGAHPDGDLEICANCGDDRDIDCDDLHAPEEVL